MTDRREGPNGFPVQWDDIVRLLRPGDIGATYGRGFLPLLHRKLFTPYTDRFHHLLIGLPTYDGDMTIYESIAKGIAVGRLSFYKNSDIKFYRVNCPDLLSRQAVDKVTEFGRSYYDYWLITRIVLFGILRLLGRALTGKFRRLRPEDIPYGSDAAYVCTEAVDMSYWKLGFVIVPKGKAPVPSAFREAEMAGRITEIAHWQGTK